MSFSFVGETQYYQVIIIWIESVLLNFFLFDSLSGLQVLEAIWPRGNELQLEIDEPASRLSIEVNGIVHVSDSNGFTWISRI